MWPGLVTSQRLTYPLGDFIERPAGRAVLVVRRELKPKTVGLIAWDDVQVEVKHLLASRLAVGDEPVDTIAFHGVVQGSRDPGSCPKQVLAHVWRQVCDSLHVGRRDQQGVTTRHRLDIEESQECAVSKHDAGWQLASDNLAEDAVLSVDADGALSETSHINPNHDGRDSRTASKGCQPVGDTLEHTCYRSWLRQTV